MKSSVVLFTGGGTAGHVLPSVPLIEGCLRKGSAIHYIGSKNGIEHKLISDFNVQFHHIASGKFRRYFSLKNFTDIFRIIWGCCQAFYILGKVRPQVIFSKGGYVTLPVVVMGWLWRIPVIAHESDMSLGLANRLAYPFVKHMCHAFPLTNRTHREKCLYTGLPLRAEILHAKAQKGRRFLGLPETGRPILLILGGSAGSKFINTMVDNHVEQWCESFSVVHICGEGHERQNEKSQKIEGYQQFAYLKSEIGDIMAAAEIVISRAGATVIHELLALKKATIFIPLPETVSRGDQVRNAQFLVQQKVACMLKQEDIEKDASLVDSTIEHVAKHKDAMLSSMQAILGTGDGTQKLLDLLEKYQVKIKIDH